MTGEGVREGRSDPRPLPRLHVVTNDALLRRAGWESLALEVLEAGGPRVAVHVRGPRTEGAEIYRHVERLLPHARRTGGSLFVNDRVDVGLVLDVDGVHLGRRSLPVRIACELLEGRAVWIGASTGEGDEAAALGEEGADYVFLGTMFETPTHPGSSGVGLADLTGAVASAGKVPVIGIGGIDPGRAGEVRRAGAWGAAVVRGVWEAPDAAAAVRSYLNAMENGRDAA